jgi:flagellar biosynthesis protein FliQ
MMDVEAAAELIHGAVVLALVLAIPGLAVAFVVSLVSGLLQGMTQIHDQSLSVVPRLLIGLLAALLLLPWMLDRLTTYTIELYQGIAGSL